jgi:minimal CRISPR polymerase-like protein
VGKLDIKPGMVYMFLDGDKIGRLCGQAVMRNDVDGLNKVSARINAAQDFVEHWLKQRDGVKISGGGDELSAAFPVKHIEDLESLRTDIEHAFGYTVSIGLGKDLAEAGKALLSAKLQGKNRIVKFSKDLKKDVQKAKRRIREKRYSPEDVKISEAYLKKNEMGNPPFTQKTQSQEQACPDQEQEEACQYCEQTDGVDPQHCQYCHEADQQEGEDDCPFCAEQDQAGATDDCPFCAESPENDSDCPYCQDDAAAGAKEPEIAEMDDQFGNEHSNMVSPDSNNASAPAGSKEEAEQAAQMGMIPPQLGKPTPGNNSSPSGAGDSQSDAYDGAASAPVAPPGADADEVQGNDVLIPEDGSQSGDEGFDIPEEGAHTTDALEAIAEQIGNEDVDGNPEEKREAGAIDDTQLAGSNMEGNISRPGNFESNGPGDIGMDSEHPSQSGDSDEWSDPFPTHPDQGGERKPGHEGEAQPGEPGAEDSKEMPSDGTAGIFKESLDNSADSIQKEKVVQMVSQALQGFKASKDMIEQAKDQNPQLYGACISMVRAMIEMCKMMGLNSTTPSDPTAPPTAPPGDDGSGDDQWSDPFPAHPDQGGAPNPTQDAGPGGAAGQPPKTDRLLGNQ